jgi:hypothetical protein
MKTGLRISILGNLLLSLAVGYLAINSRLTGSTETEKLRAQIEAVGESTIAADRIEVRANPAEVSFHWNQLEVGGCREYISRLRHIGCPEPTIRDIMIGDVNRLYASRRAQLNLDGSGVGPWSVAEENRLVAHLFREDPGPGLSSEVAAEAGGAARGTTASMPLVFQTASMAGLMLDEGQWEGLEELRQQFIAEVGGLDQSPNDPGYAARWQRAQPMIDALVAGMLGRETFLQMQMQSPDASAE